MWIMTVGGGFVSLVQDRDDASKLQVRARVRQDIVATFPGAEVFALDGADYRYRARVARQEVAQTLANAVLDINYDSHFKDVAIERSPANPERQAAMYGVWTAMARMQDYAPYSRTLRTDGDDRFPAEVWPEEIERPSFTMDDWVWDEPDKSERDQ